MTYKIDKGRSIPGVHVVSLEFRDERDEKMLAAIADLAAEHRRNPEQEIMWILQHYVEAERTESVSREA